MKNLKNKFMEVLGSFEGTLFYWYHFAGWKGQIGFWLVYIIFIPLLILDWLCRKR